MIHSNNYIQVYLRLHELLPTKHEASYVNFDIYPLNLIKMTTV